MGNLASDLLCKDNLLNRKHPEYLCFPCDLYFQRDLTPCNRAILDA